MLLMLIFPTNFFHLLTASLISGVNQVERNFSDAESEQNIDTQILPRFYQRELLFFYLRKQEISDPSLYPVYRDQVN